MAAAAAGGLTNEWGSVIFADDSLREVSIMDSVTIDFIVGVGILLIAACLVFIILLLNEKWNFRFDRMSHEIKVLSNRVDHLEQRLDHTRESIARMREGRLTGIKPEGRFRG